MTKNEELRDTKCKNCIYEWSCIGITDPLVREVCQDQKKPRNDIIPEWGEMSYHRLEYKTNFERMRNETAHRGNY